MASDEHEQDHQHDSARLNPGALLRDVRHRADLSQRELAARAGVDRSVVAKIESGMVLAPGYVTMVRLLAAAGCRLQVVDLAGRPVQPRPFDDALDAGFRRWPSHLDVRPVRTEQDWWYGPYLTDLRPLPRYTADWRRPRGRTRARPSAGPSRIRSVPCRIALVGDRNEQYPSHKEVDAVLPMLGEDVVAEWVGTDGEGVGDLGAFDGIWLLPGSPYRNDEAAYDAITYARTRG